MKKLFSGVVTSDKMNKTITVKVETKSLHPKYRKLVISHKKFHVHDEKENAHVGDKVTFAETSPISKTKKYTLVKINEVNKKVLSNNEGGNK